MWKCFLLILIVVIGLYFYCVVKINSLKYGGDENKSKYAFVFAMFCGDSYLPGVLTAAYSLMQTNTSHDVICMVTDDVSSEAVNKMEKIGIKVVHVPYLRYKTSLKNFSSTQLKIYNKWMNVSYTKWNCMNLTDYKKILFLDADCLVLKNIDHVFNYNAPASVFDDRDGAYAKFKKLRRHIKKYVTPDKMKQLIFSRKFLIDGGCVLLEPNAKLFEAYKNHVRINQPYVVGVTLSGADEQSLSYFMSVDKTGPSLTWYNLGKRYMCSWFFNCKDPYVLNYIGAVKPWHSDIRKEFPDTIPWYKMHDKVMARIT